MRIKPYFTLFLLSISVGLFAWQLYWYYQPNWELAFSKLKIDNKPWVYNFGYFAGLNFRLLLALIILFIIRKPLVHFFKK